MGRCLNKYQWSLSQAWVTHDENLAAQARRVGEDLVDAVRDLCRQPEGQDRLNELVREQTDVWSRVLGSVDHVEAVRLADRELRISNQVEPDDFAELQRRACWNLLRPVRSGIGDIRKAIRRSIPQELRWLLALGIHVDRGIRPAADLGRTFVLGGPVEGQREASAIGWGMVRTDPSGADRVLPTQARTSDQQSVTPDWLRTVWSIWRNSPVPDRWCPVQDEQTVLQLEPPMVRLVELIDAVMAEFVIAPDSAVIRRDTSSGRFHIGPFGVRPLRRQRKGKTRANVREVLEEFAKQGWPTEILRTSDSDTWTETKRQLAHGLRLIEFKASPGGKIAWSWDLRSLSGETAAGSL